MTEISGSLKLVTGSPAAVSQVWLRAPNGRVQGSEYVTEAPDTIQVTGGAVSFEALPGAMVMTLISHGSPMHTVKLLVPDKTSATLAECIEAAELATDGTRSALERLALEVQAELGQVPALVSDALAQDATIIDAVKQASVIREDTTVGTRVFAGDIMVFGDTGWRDISADVSDRESGRLLIRRIGEQVFVVADALKLTSTGSVTLPRLEGSFRPVSRVRGVWNESLSSDTAKGSYNISNTGYFNVYSVGTGEIEINETFITDDSWPSSLPGTPS